MIYLLPWMGVLTWLDAVNEEILKEIIPAHERAFESIAQLHLSLRKKNLHAYCNY